jgi:hypothetical protein
VSVLHDTLGSLTRRARKHNRVSVPSLIGPCVLVRRMMHSSDKVDVDSATDHRNQILSRVAEDPSAVWTPGDFAVLAGRAAIDKALQHLALNTTLGASTVVTLHESVRLRRFCAFAAENSEPRTGLSLEFAANVRMQDVRW